jgi:hypothetical protein
MTPAGVGDAQLTVPDLATRIRALEAQLRRLRLLAVDELVRILVATIAGRGFAFNAHEVWTHARLVSPALRQALRAADLTSARQLGKWLQHLQGRDVYGLRLVRIGADYHGAVWMFVESDAHTQGDPCAPSVPGA